MLFVEEAEEKKKNKFKAKEIDWLYSTNCLTNDVGSSYTSNIKCAELAMQVLFQWNR